MFSVVGKWTKRAIVIFIVRINEIDLIKRVWFIIRNIRFKNEKWNQRRKN